MAGSNKPLISVCIGSIRAKTLPFLVQSIICQTFQEWELIISIQGDDKELFDYVTHLARTDPRISFNHLTRFGRSHAINQAVKRAKADIVAITDDDCVAAVDWLATIYECFSSDPSVGLVAGDTRPSPARPFRISTCPATFTIECIYRPGKENNYTAPPGFYCGGGNMALRRSVVDLVGPFDEYLGTGSEFPGAEDVDFCLRAEALGVVMWTTPRSIIYHTFGRRYGLKNFLNYHRFSSQGSGGLLGKLVLRDHRLAKVWGRKRHAGEWAVRFIQNPPRALVDMYKEKYKKIGCANFLAKYAIDEDNLTCPKSRVTKRQY